MKVLAPATVKEITESTELTFKNYAEIIGQNSSMSQTVALS